MSALLPTTLRPTHLDASQGAEGLPSAPFNVGWGRVYPILYPWPGSSQPPLASLPNATLRAIPPLALGAYGPNHAPTFQGHSAISSPNFTPMNNANLWASHYLFNGTLLQNATSATTLQPSKATGHHKPSAPVTFQSPFPTQPEAGWDQCKGQHRLQAAQQDLAVKKPPKEPRQVRRKGYRPAKNPRAAHVAPAVHLQSDQTNNQVHPGQHHLQAAQEDLAVEEPLKKPGQVQRKDHEADKDPHAAHAAPAVHLQRDQTNNQVHPLEAKLAVHTCFNNPDSQCSRRGTVCLDSLHTFVSECPVTLSDEQIVEYVIAAMAPELSEKQPAGQPSQVDTTDPPPFKNTPSSLETASTSWSTVASASTSVHSSPNGSALSAPDQPQGAASSLMSSTSCSAGKRQRSEDYSEDRPKKQQRKECTDTRDDEDHLEPCENQTVDCREKPCKEKKPSDHEYICRICMIHAKSSQSLSHPDALKRHIEFAHKIFLVLFDHEEFNILKPRRNDQFENLVPLIRFCIPLQLQAQKHGVEIKPEQDLTILYPHTAAFLNHS